MAKFDFKNPIGRLLKNKTTLMEDIRVSYVLLRDLGISPFYFFSSVFCDVIAAALNYAKLFTLLPLLGTLIQGNTNGLHSIWLIVVIEKYFPVAATPYAFPLAMGILVAVALLQIAAQCFSGIFMEMQARQANSKLRSKVYSRYLQFGKHFYDQANLSKLNAVLLKNTEHVSRQFQSLHLLLSELVRLISFIWAMLASSLRMTLLIVVIVQVYTFISSAFSRALRAQASAQKRSDEKLERTLFNSLVCIPLVKMFATEKKETERFQVLSDQQIESLVKRTKTENIQSAMEELSALLSIVTLAFYMVCINPAKNAEETSVYLLFFFLVRNVGMAFSAFDRFTVNFSISHEFVQEIVGLTGPSHEKFILKEGSVVFTPPKEAIRFTDIEFQYPGKSALFEKVSFSIPCGKTTVIVGETGCGKTTLIQLLMRYYDPNSGKILFDGTDLKDFQLPTLRQQVSYVSQDSIFFSDTILENLTYGLQRPVTEDEIYEICEVAQIAKTIRATPDKLLTHIGDLGSRLSGGEKQRLAIARALLRNPKVLVLDEATSALDIQTESLIVKGFNRMISGMTVIMVTHRPALLELGDCIIHVAEGGKISVEQPDTALRRLPERIQRDLSLNTDKRSAA